MKKIFVVTLLCVSVLSLSACSTVDGIGQDLSKASRAVEGSM